MKPARVFSLCAIAVLAASGCSSTENTTENTEVILDSVEVEEGSVSDSMLYLDQAELGGDVGDPARPESSDEGR